MLAFEYKKHSSTSNWMSALFVYEFIIYIANELVDDMLFRTVLIFIY